MLGFASNFTKQSTIAFFLLEDVKNERVKGREALKRKKGDSKVIEEKSE